MHSFNGRSLISHFEVQSKRTEVGNYGYTYFSYAKQFCTHPYVLEGCEKSLSLIRYMQWFTDANYFKAWLTSARVL